MLTELSKHCTHHPPQSPVHPPPPPLSYYQQAECQRLTGRQEKGIIVMFPNTVNCMRCVCFYKTKHLECFKRWTHFCRSHIHHMLSTEAFKLHFAGVQPITVGFITQVLQLRTFPNSHSHLLAFLQRDICCETLSEWLVGILQTLQQMLALT